MGPSPGAGDVIEVHGLGKRYGRRGRIRAVTGVGFRVGRGEVFGLIGPDGAGKTSVLQILAGVLSADGGSARVAGVDVIRDPEGVKGIIGYMPQGLGQNLYDALTVEENVEFFRDLRRVPRARYRENRDRLMEMTRLEPFLRRPAGKLSGGMRQKLALICTLIHLPDVLLLDEPTTGVDPISRRDFWTIVHTLVTGRGVTVLLTTSYMDEAERCHRVSLMHEGAVIAAGPPETLTGALEDRLFAVRGVEPSRALEMLRRTADVESATVAGNELRVVTAQADADLQARLAAIDGDGIAVASVRPGLEDVFVHHLTRGRALPPAASLLVGRPGGAHLDGAAPRDAGPPAMDAGEEAVVAADRLTCRFGDFTAVDTVSLEIRPAEILGLLGPNGAGKTTLIKMLCGLLPPTAGTARVAGLDVRGAGAELRRRLGYMSQRFSLYRDQTVRENLALTAGLYGIPVMRRTARIEALLSGLGLSAFADRLPQALPLGLRQRLALASAILHEPSVLFLDEPTAGVDPLARRQFWDLVHLLAHERGVAVLVSTHFMDEVTHADRLGFMHEGRLVALGPPAEITRQAEAEGGPMVALETPHFARAFVLIHARFPRAMLYGRRIRWQSARPEADRERAGALLAEAGIEARAEIQPLSMEDTFVSVLRAAGLGRG